MAQYFSFVEVVLKSPYLLANGIRENPSTTPSVALYPRYTNQSISCVASSALPALHQFVPAFFVTDKAAVTERTVSPIRQYTGSEADGSVPANVLRATVRLFDVTDGTNLPLIRNPCGAKNGDLFSVGINALSPYVFVAFWLASFVSEFAVRVPSVSTAVPVIEVLIVGEVMVGEVMVGEVRVLFVKVCASDAKYVAIVESFTFFVVAEAFSTTGYTSLSAAVVSSVSAEIFWSGIVLWLYPVSP